MKNLFFVSLLSLGLFLGSQAVSADAGVPKEVCKGGRQSVKVFCKTNQEHPLCEVLENKIAFNILFKSLCKDKDEETGEKGVWSESEKTTIDQLLQIPAEGHQPLMRQVDAVVRLSGMLMMRHPDYRGISIINTRFKEGFVVLSGQRPLEYFDKSVLHKDSNGHRPCLAKYRNGNSCFSVTSHLEITDRTFLYRTVIGIRSPDSFMWYSEGHRDLFVGSLHENLNKTNNRRTQAMIQNIIERLNSLAVSQKYYEAEKKEIASLCDTDGLFSGINMSIRGKQERPCFSEMLRRIKKLSDLFGAD